MTKHDPRTLRDAFGTFMTGVTVVTTRAADGTPVGFTANSFTSVSLDPPLVLVCLANSSGNFETFTSAGGFAINILSEEQKEVSSTFARRIEDRFAKVAWRDGPHGAPLIEGVSAWFDCSMFKTVDAGDHTILIGRVEAFEASPTPGLGYARGAYVTPAVEMAALEQGVDLVLSVLIRHERKVLLVEGKDGALTLPETRVGKAGVSQALADLLDKTGLSAEPGFIYAVYDDPARNCHQITFQCAAEDGTPRAGSFAQLGPEALARIADPAMRQMLTRFAEETRIGNFGVYYGGRETGHVHKISTGG